MKAYKFILMSGLLFGILALFGVIIAGAFGTIAPDAAFVAGASAAFVDFFLLIAAKSVVEAELKIASRDKKPRVETT